MRILALAVALIAFRVSSEPTLNEDRFTALDALVEAERTRTGAPGVAIVIVEGDRLVFARGYGMANVETSAPVTADTLFQIGSVTKPFTAAAILSAFAESGTSLDTPVASLVSGLVPCLGQATIGQLLSHSGGLIDEPDEFGAQGEDGLASYPRTWSAEYCLLAPGRAFSYSNSGYALAGLALQEREKKPFADVMRARVLEPLGMTRTTFRPTEAMTWPLAVGHRRRDNRTEVVRPLPNDARLWPAGTLYSTANEMGRFLIALVNDGRIDGRQALPSGVVRSMREPHTAVPTLDIEYGYGLQISRTAGQQRLGHAGAMTGYGAVIGLSTERRLGVAVLANGDGVQLNAVAERALEIAGAGPSTKAAGAAQPALTLPAAKLDAYVGKFTNPRRFTVEVVRQRDALVLRRFGRDFPMQPSAPDRFRVDLPSGGQESIVFGAGADGRADYLQMNVWALARLSPSAELRGRLAEITTANGQARAAHAAGDRAAFLQSSERAATLAPSLPNQLYNLACAQALNGQGDAAIATLRRVAATGVTFDLAAETDFASLTSRADFQQLAADMKRTEGAMRGESPILFTLPQRDLITEGVAIDPSTGDFYVSAAYRRKVLRVRTNRGRFTATDFVAEGQDGLHGVTGLEIDAPRRRLWVCSSSRPHMHGGTSDDPRRAEIVALDLATAKIVSRHPIAAGEPGHGCDSLAVGRDGTVYTSDPLARVVWRLPAGAATPLPLVEAGVLPSPQDLALSAAQDALYVADYARGIFRVALPSGDLQWLDAPADGALTGIDGLELDPARSRLIAIQNGISPHRILSIELDATGTKIVKSDVLAQNIQGWDEPTLGTIHGRELIYVGRSQWRFFDREGKLGRVQDLAEPAVFRVRLDGSSGR